MNIIDLESWNRKEHFLFYQQPNYDHYNMGVNWDITNFKERAKQ